MADAIVPAPPLPSQSSASALVRGDVTALPTVLLHLLGRGVIIGAGIAAVGGERDPKKLVTYGLGGSIAVELFVLIHELVNRP
jgi:hypothetical protein